MAEEANVAALNIELRMRLDDAEDKLRKIEDRATKTGREIEKKLEGTKAFSGLTKGALRGVAAIGAITTAAALANVAFIAMKGDIEDTAEAIKSLPFGLGGLARQLETVLGHITGISDEIERTQEQVAFSRQLFDVTSSIIKSRASALDASKNITEQLRQQVELLGKSKNEQLAIVQQRERNAIGARFNRDLLDKGLKLTQAEKQQVADLGEKVRKLGEDYTNINTKLRARIKLQRMAGNTPDPLLDLEVISLEKEKTRLKNQLDFRTKRLADLTNRTKEEIQIESDRDKAIALHERLSEAERVKLAEQQIAERQARQEREAKAEQSIRKRQQLERERAEITRLSKMDQLASIESQIRQKQLRMSKRFAEAEREAIEESFRSQIRAAQRAGDAILEAKLKTLRDLRIAELRDRARVEGSAMQIDPGSVRGVVSQQEDRQRKASEAARRALQRDRDIDQRNKQRQNEVERGRSIHGAAFGIAENMAREQNLRPSQHGSGDIFERMLEELQQITRGLVG